MRRSTLITDVVISVVLAALVLTFVAGLAIAALVALILLVICGVSYLIDLKRGRPNRRRGLRRRKTPPRPRRTPRPR